MLLLLNLIFVLIIITKYNKCNTENKLVYSGNLCSLTIYVILYPA